jgi:hypothetical protein
VNLISLLLSVVLSLGAWGIAGAEELSLDQTRRLVAADVKSNGVESDSVCSPIRVAGYGEKVKDFILVPVAHNGKLSAVYRDDPKRNSVTLVTSGANAQALKLDLFSLDGARREMARQSVVNPMPKLICVGPISLLGALTAGWYHDTGDSFVLLSLSGRLVTESDIVRYWPEHLEALRSVGQ